MIARHIAGPLNVNGQSEEQFQGTIAEILTWLNASGLRPENCGGVGIGAAGISNPHARQLLTNAFARGGYRVAIYTYSDAETALATAFPECHGIILIAGTGSICLGRRESGEMVRAGGYGHLIDDGGSAYAIAIAALSAVIRAEDHRAKPTALRHLVMEKIGIGSLEDLIDYVYAPVRSKKEIASLAVVVEQAVRSGDAAAIEIEHHNAEELSLLVRTVMERLPEENNIALAGSVLLHNQNTPLSQKHLQEYRKWLAELAAEAAATGEYGWCDPEVWEYFDPHTGTGEQILSSLTEQELFEPVLATMDRPGHTPDFDRVYVIYRKYLSWRYGSMNVVKFRARTLYKQRAAKQLCPPDWPSRVSAEALIAKCEEQGISVSQEERARLEDICAGIVKKGQPVLPETLPTETRGFLNRLAGSWRNAFKLMGIPVATKQQISTVQSGKDMRRKGR